MRKHESDSEVCFSTAKERRGGVDIDRIFFRCRRDVFCSHQRRRRGPPLESPWALTWPWKGLFWGTKHCWRSSPQHPHLLAQGSVIRHLRDQRQHAHSPAPISTWASWPSAPCISAESGRWMCSGSDSNQGKRAGALCPASGGRVPGSPLQPCLWTQPQVQACLLGEGVPTVLSPKHFSLRPTQSIQHCHPVLPPNSQLPQRTRPPSNTRS